jgi:nicotinamide-nucleotide adenylyltransferase
MDIKKLLKRGLYIGRFQPFHKGHLNSLKWCSDKVDELIIAVGSSDKSFELRNPFTAGERIEIIRENITNEIREKCDKIIPIPVPDVGVHLLWTYNMDLLVPRYNVVFTNDPFTSMLYKERGVKIMHPDLINREFLSATEVRHRIARNKNWEELVPTSTIKLINEIEGVDRIRNLYNLTKSNVTKEYQH